MQEYNGTNYDPETGEVLSNVKASVSINGGPEMPFNPEAAIQRLDHVQNTQLRLFEGNRIHIVEQKLKSATLSCDTIDATDKPPRLYETKYFVIEAKALKIDHSVDKDDLLTKTVRFSIQESKEIDELTCKRIMAGM